MDTLYVGDIPQSYHYAIYGNGYIDLFNTATLYNGTYQYYRIWLYDNQFMYETGSRNYGSYNTTYATSINVTDNIRYRRDFPDIVQTIFIYCLLFVFLVNLVTSAVKKGGMLGGLL